MNPGQCVSYREAEVLDLTQATTTSIEEFCLQMHQEMQKHRNEKGDWRQVLISDALFKIHQHREKLWDALTNQNKAEARKQAVHAANYCMMLYSLLGEEC